MGALVVSGPGGDPPEKCFVTNDQGELPTCTTTGDGGWQVTYPSDDATGGEVFGALFLLALLAGIAFTVWKVSTARRMAREAGMDEGDATAMTLLTDEGFEATYLASNVRTAPGTGTPVPPSAAQRLRDLEALRTEGLLTEEEYAERRRAILAEL